MGIEENQLKLVELALSGHKESLNQLTEVVQAPLRSYILRITFKEEITDDIVQETLLEMFKIFKQLKQADHFWPWLCKIALNKIRNYTRTESRHLQLLKEHGDELTSRSSTQKDGVATAIYDEFKQCIFEAMSQLSDRQKAVLSMRCYEKMSYGQIAEIMGISELGCRLLFIRAKKKLQGKLFRLGYGQKSLLMALVLFGKSTAPSGATAAQISITPAVLSGGVMATGIATVTSKAALTMAAGGIVVAGTITMASHSFQSRPIEPALGNSVTTPMNVSAGNDIHTNEGYFFFPQGKYGPVLTKLMIHDGDNFVQKLQNDTGNYSYDAKRQAVTINNYHYWKSDLSVMSLPTDSTNLESFLAQIEGRKPRPRTINANSPNLFIVASFEGEHRDSSYVVKEYEALMEERFRYNWPAQAGLQDDRDSLHRQGWCYFKMRGQLHGKTITGNGRLPFVYAMALEKPAWLNVTVADQLTLLDAPSGAVMLDAAGHPVSTYPAGTFLNGLNRSWDGLHVIDTVRRDAALSHIPFSTELEANGARGLVSLQLADGKMEYKLDMNKDLIERIEFRDSTGNTVGEIVFDYLSPDALRHDEFAVPRLPFGVSPQKTEQLHWLSALAANTL